MSKYRIERLVAASERRRDRVEVWGVFNNDDVTGALVYLAVHRDEAQGWVLANRAEGVSADEAAADVEVIEPFDAAFTITVRIGAHADAEAFACELLSEIEYRVDDTDYEGISIRFGCTPEPMPRDDEDYDPERDDFDNETDTPADYEGDKYTGIGEVTP